jgi:hypothetical protein
MTSESSAFRRLAAILTLQGFASIAATEESVWCSESSFDTVEPQQIIDPTDIIEIAWLNTNNAPANKGCGQLPRATWTIEPAPVGVDKTLIWMSPPDLGVAQWWSTARGYTTLQGIEFNQTRLNNLPDESDIGVLIQVPRDELQWVEVSYGSPLRINIASGFSNIVVLKVVNTNNPSTVGNYSCGSDGQLAATGLGTTLRADLSTVNVTTKSRISLKFDGDGVDASIKLPNVGYPVNQMKLSGYNSKYSIKGNVNCTGQVGGVFDCYLRGGSAGLCTKDCYSQLVVDGSIDGNVAISPLTPSLVANVSASDGCNHFVPDFDQVDLSNNFICTEGAAANAAVKVQPLPCMMQAREMRVTDVVNCPEQDSNSPYKCHCYVPTTATCPSANSAPTSGPGPATSPGSIGPFLSNTVALGLAGILLCYNLGVILF